MKFLASHESSTRGTFDFPIELYYVDKMHPRYEMPFHWHMEFELMMVLSGEFSLLIDGRSYLLHKGDAAIASSAAAPYVRQNTMRFLNAAHKSSRINRPAP